MKGRIALVDYGAGNLASVRKALCAVRADVYTPARPADLRDAAAIVVPGVGHFAATASLDARWREAMTAAIDVGRPLLGICLGMQWLFEGSAEAPELTGLGVFKGTCTLLTPVRPADQKVAQGLSPVSHPRIKVPHVGWNSIDVIRPSRLFAGVATGAQAYFTHSYAAPVTEDTTATTEHGARFASAAGRGAVTGVQFHPEKSGDTGLAILSAFMRLVQEA